MNPLRDRSVRFLLLVLFFLSGACGLVYEVVWMRMLTLVFGATAFATSAILASFFAGLALGSFHFGRTVDRTANPLRLYALLEAGIGVLAFLMPALFAGVTWVYVALARHLPLGYYGLSMVRLLLSFVILLLPTTLMGGTLPVIVKFFARREDRVGWNVGALYAVNTFGAVVGTVTAGFFLILFLGLREATWLAAVVNLAVAGVVYLLSRRPEPVGEPETREEAVGAPELAEEAGAPATLTTEGPVGEGAVTGAVEGPEAPVPAPAEPARPVRPPLSPGLYRLTLWAIGISGLCALALEVLWTRALVFFLDNSTHAFTTMLTAFLLGIAVGSAVLARVIDSRRRLLAWLGGIEVLIGITALLAIPVLGWSTPVFARMGDTDVTPEALLWKWTVLRFLTSLAVMLVPTVLMGATVPLAARIYTPRVKVVGSALGRVYSVNTVGGVVGSVLGGFVLIPLLGVHDGILLVALVSVLLGAVLLLQEPTFRLGKPLKATAGVVLLVGAAGVFWGVRGRMMLTSYREQVDASQVLWYHEGIGSTVKVFEDHQGARVVSIDGFPVAGETFGLRDAQAVLGNLPLLLSDVPGARVNLVGFGAGGASWAGLQYDVSQVECVELVPAVLQAAKWFPDVNHGVLDNPRFHAILDDGRNHALVSDETYDVITIDATSPKMAGNGSLYTREFYQLLERRLSPDGIVAQWLPFHLLSQREMRMTAKTFMEVFPHTTVWLSPIRHHAVLVGTREKLQIDYAALARKLQRPGVRQELGSLKVTDPLDVLEGFVMGEEGLARYVQGARVNTDDHPYLEFTPAMAYFYTMTYVVRNLYDLGQARESVLPLLVNTGDTEEERADLAERVERRLQASQHTISGDILYYLGEQDRALGEYRRALVIDPTEKNWVHPIWHDLRLGQGLIEGR